MNKLILFLGSFLVLGSLACITNDSEVHGNKDSSTTTQDKVPVYTPVPDSYTQEIEQAGTIESVTYSTQNSDGSTINKIAYVYLPYQYDSSQQYNILYLMHGGGGNSSTLMGNTNRSTTLKFVIDNMIYNKHIKPFIIVTPSFYMVGDSDFGGIAGAGNLTHAFQTELRDDLIPAVESKYSTYALSTSVEDLTNSRNHRAFSGFSMGGVTTWYAIAENLAYFQKFIPASGDCWAIEQMGGRIKPQETAEYIANSIKEQGYSPLGLFIFAVTGTQDIAYETLSAQIEAMKTLTNDFIYDHDPAKGNLYYLEAQDGLHDYDWYTDYLYDILPYIF